MSTWREEFEQFMRETRERCNALTEADFARMDPPEREWWERNRKTVEEWEHSQKHRTTRVEFTKLLRDLAAVRCPESQFIVISAGAIDSPQVLDIATSCNVLSPKHAIALLEYALEDLRGQVAQADN